MNSRSTRPEHMTRMSLISFAYCSLETPAVSAAPYAHQWHRNPSIFGLKFALSLIRYHLTLRSGIKAKPWGLGRVDLVQYLFVGKMLQHDGPGGALGIAEAVPLAEDGIDPGLPAQVGLDELDGAVGAGGDAGPA